MLRFDKIYQYNFPTTIRFGAGAVKELADYLKANKLQKPLIVTDPVVRQLGFFKYVSNVFEIIFLLFLKL